MIFDQPPAGLPTATLRPRESGTQLSLDLRNWLQARWLWLRPRTIPVLVATAGLVAVLASASYLRNLALEAPEQLTVRPLQVHIATNEPTTMATRPGILRVEAPAAETVVYIEGTATIAPMVMTLTPSPR